MGGGRGGNTGEAVEGKNDQGHQSLFVFSSTHHLAFGASSSPVTTTTRQRSPASLHLEWDKDPPDIQLLPFLICLSREGVTDSSFAGLDKHLFYPCMDRRPENHGPRWQMVPYAADDRCGKIGTRIAHLSWSVTPAQPPPPKCRPPDNTRARDSAPLT